MHFSNRKLYTEEKTVMFIVVIIVKWVVVWCGICNMGWRGQKPNQNSIVYSSHFDDDGLTMNLTWTIIWGISLHYFTSGIISHYPKSLAYRQDSRGRTE